MAAHAAQPIIYSEPPVRKAPRRRSSKAVRRARTLTVLFVLLVAALVLLFPRVVHTQPHSEMASIEHTVAPGDTLWAIAAQHAGNRDVREVVYQIKKANGLRSAAIQPGQVIVIPATLGNELAGR